MAKRTPSSGVTSPQSQRQLRVGELIRHAIAEILQRGEVHDPVLENCVVTVPEVRVGPDLKNATVYAVALGGADTDAVIAALKVNKRFLRGEIARRVSLKCMPALAFQADTTFDQADAIDDLLHDPRVSRDLGPREEG